MAGYFNWRVWIGNYTILFLARGMSIQLKIGLAAVEEEPTDSQLEADHQECSGSSNLVELAFDKHYPQTLLTLAMEYLHQTGIITRAGVCRGRCDCFEGRHFISLSTLYQLISQPWYIGLVDRQHAVVSVCARVLGSTRIKSKLFHITMAKLVFGRTFANKTSFKSLVSTMANDISGADVQNDDLFNFPTLAHYFLYIMVAHLYRRMGLELAFSVIRGQLEELNLNHNAKDKLNFCVETLYGLFKAPCFPTKTIPILCESLGEVLAAKESDFCHKYKLPLGVLNWRVFMVEVAEKCLQLKQRNIKITRYLIHRCVESFRTAYVKACSRVKSVLMRPEHNGGTECIVTYVIPDLVFDSRSFVPFSLIAPPVLLEPQSSHSDSTGEPSS